MATVHFSKENLTVEVEEETSVLSLALNYDGTVEVGTIIKTFNKQIKKPKIPARFLKK